MTSSQPSEGLKIAIDRGGTFTDVYASGPGLEKPVIIKLLSVDPTNYPDAPAEGIRRVLELATSEKLSRGQKIDSSPIEAIRMGTTVATNALLERAGEKHCLAVTKGFKDLLSIGQQNRPALFDLHIKKPDTLHTDVIEIDERITFEDYTYNPVKEEIDCSKDENLVLGRSGDVLRILKRPDEETIRTDLKRLRDAGYESLAICLTHSFTFPDHELVVEKIAKEVGFKFISTSSSLLPMIKMVSRGQSATADAYLTPYTKRYLEGFVSNFDGGFKATRVEFMQSDGGLVSYDKFSGLKAILSGPAGGVVGYAQTSWAKEEKAVIGFDMGGTSTDVSRFDGNYEHLLETITAGVTIQSPQLDIHTVAAGGGSILTWKSGIMAAGPESASAHPGPACYRKGGPLAVTDANLILGRLLPESFPSIFGPNEDQPLDVEVVKQKFEELAAKISKDTGVSKTPEEVASGFISVANESMARAIRAITEARGYDTANHNLSCFGGAGGQHAAEIAKMLRIKTVIIHKYSSILSAFGMALADLVSEVQLPSNLVYDEKNRPSISKSIEGLKVQAREELLEQGISESSIQFEVYLNMRYYGTDTPLMILEPADGNFEAEYLKAHQREFTFLLHGRDILVDDIRVRAIGSSSSAAGSAGMAPFKELEQRASSLAPVNEEEKMMAKSVYFDEVGYVTTPVYELNKLAPGTSIEGPAMIIDATQTIVIPPRCAATILTSHVIIDVDIETSKQLRSDVIDPIQLSVFSQRFMAIAEQMGRTLQKTAVSANISERLDFSCALFGPDGGLVANAPHVPVHLGSMQYAIQYQHELHKGKLRPGDVLLSNHPVAGGTHLPDLTVITPCFDAEGKEIVFYCASRGHHTDIGGNGITSMSPLSHFLWEEGAAIKSFKLVSEGRFDEEGVKRIFEDEPAQHPGCSGTRRLNDNISDLKAQISANSKGIQLIHALFKECGQEAVIMYMEAIRKNAEIAVRKFLVDYATANGNVIEAIDHLDDGSPIQLKVTIDAEAQRATFDFTGTGAETYTNLNTPIAVTHSAIMYCLRCMVNLPNMPLNQGCLAPVEVIMPDNCVLNPSEDVAVCAGNPVTSQRIVDVIFRAFKVVAASQGDSNCLGFGFGGKDPATGIVEKGFAYGETICGGAGAGPGFAGASGVHVHMTNTRITDPEVLEKRYPVLLRRFELRDGSGGVGKWNGGMGVIREIQCRRPLRVSIISERRVNRPYGMMGGEPGQAGLNTWIRRRDGKEKRLNLTSRALVQMDENDSVEIRTPGGGAWGKVES